MQPLYLAVSLPAEFDFRMRMRAPRLLRDVVLPAARRHRLVFCLMAGRAAGSQSGFAISRATVWAGPTVTALERLCRRESDVRFPGDFSFPRKST